MDGPAFDLIANDFSSIECNEFNEMPVLKVFEDAQRLPLEPGSEPLRQFLQGADPLTGIDCEADAIDPSVRGTEVGVATKDGVIKKAGAAAYANAPVLD